MKKKLRRVSLVFFLAGLVVLFQSAGAAQSEKGDVSSIVGVWRTTVTLRVCATGAPIPGLTFPGILLFEGDGTMTGTSTAVTSAYGLWSREAGAREYSFSSISFRYDPAGVLLGTRRIEQTVTMGLNGNIFNSSGTFQDHDLAGNLAGSGCSTSVGTRFES